MIDDAQLIAETLTGDDDCFGELVQKYQDRLFNTMVHVTGSREEAEDVTQEAFVQAYLKLSSFAGKSVFYTWLYRIAFNASISRNRRKRPNTSLDRIREASGQDPVDTQEPAEVTLERREQVAQVHDAIAELSDEHRSILVLRDIDGCGYDRIAETLSLPIGTVRSRLHRARHQLRERLQVMLQQPS